MPACYNAPQRDAVAPAMIMRAVLREAIETVALVLFFVLVLQSAIQNYRVEGPSMLPYMENLDRVLVNKLGYTAIDAERAIGWIPSVDVEEGTVWRPMGEPSVGDVVVFRWPVDERQFFVKRIIGLPGDTIRIERGVVYRNGSPLEEPYIEHESYETIVGRIIQEGEYYVLGDNRAQSDDSRRWGSVPEENIIGEVWLTYWPFNRFTLF